MPRQTKKRSKILSDKMESNILDPVSTTKKKQHVDINKRQNVVKNEDLFKKIALLEDKVQTSIAERLQYEKSIKNKEQKWQKTLSMKTQEVKMFRIKMQKLRTLQMQEKKKMEHEIKILKQRIKEVKKNSHKNMIREISDICTANLTTQFKEVFEPLKRSGYKFDVEDVIDYLKIKNLIIKTKQNQTSSDSSTFSDFSTLFFHDIHIMYCTLFMDEMDDNKSEEDTDTESEEDTDTESEEDTDTESEEDMDKESQKKMEKESEKNMDNELEKDMDKKSEKMLDNELEKDMDKKSEKDMDKEKEEKKE